MNNTTLPNAINSKQLIFTKGQNAPLISHFRLNEFDCKCSYDDCTHTPIDFRVLIALNRLRDVLGIALIITSAYRCIRHNIDVGGVLNPISKHTKGMAVDIIIPLGNADIFIQLCRQYFPVVIPYLDKNFVHCQFN